MAVKLDKTFRDVKFRGLSKNSKLLYFYLVTHKDLSIVGTLILDLEIFLIQSTLTLEELRSSSRELIDNNYLCTKMFGETVYFIIPEHFNTIPKSEATINKVNRVLKDLPEELVRFLDSKGINTTSKIKKFVKPTAKEVTEHGLSLGYLIDGEEFIRSYEEYSDRYGKKDIWVDSRGTQVRDWKAKLRKIWCKEERKLKKFDDAPKGFETFYIFVEGKITSPDGWRGGKPFSKSLPIDIELKKHYERRNKKS